MSIFETQALHAIGGVNAADPTTQGTAVAQTGYLPATERATSATGSTFESTLVGAVENLQGLQRTSNDLAVKAVTGDLDDIHDYTVAATEAKLTLELTAAVRNKAVDAFTEIMRMQA